MKDDAAKQFLLISFSIFLFNSKTNFYKLEKQAKYEEKVKNNLIIVMALLVLVLGFFAKNLGYVGRAVYQCSDSDNMDFYTKGIVRSSGFTAEDTCIADKKLQEFSCTKRSRVSFVIVDCPKGCKDGACIKSEGYIKPVQESAQISTNVNKLELNENLGDVVEVLTENDLDALKDGVISTSEGSTRYSQYIRFKNSDFSSGKVVHDENEDGEVGNYLFFEGDEVIYEYEIQFDQGLNSDVLNSRLEDLEGRSMYILGRKYTIVSAALSGETVELRLMSGSKIDTIEEGETKAYLVDGNEYRIELRLLDDENQRAIFSVNGNEVGTMRKGDTVSIGNLLLGLTETYQSEAGEGSDMVRFSLGAEQIVLKDNAGDNAFTTGVKINSRSVSAGSVKIKGQTISGGYKISSIKYRLKADADRGGDVYIPEGHVLSEYIEDSLGIIGGWDIAYKGITSRGSGTESIIRLNPSGDDEYRLSFINNKGDSYNFPFVQNVGGSLVIGDDDDTLHFIESSSASDFKVSQGDWVVMTNRNDRGGTTNILRFSSVDASNKQLHFDDLATGSKTMTYSGTEGSNAQGDLVVSGNSYKIFVGPAPDYKLAVDLTDDGSLSGREASIVVNGGGILDLGSTSSPGSSFTITLKTEARQFDEASTDEVISMTIQNTGSGVDINIPSQSGLSIETENGRIRAMSNYGIEFLQRRNGADSLTIAYPSGSQSVADVSVVFYGAPPELKYELLHIEEADTEEPIDTEEPETEAPAQIEVPRKVIERPIQKQEYQPSFFYRIIRSLLSLISG